MRGLLAVLVFSAVRALAGDVVEVEVRGVGLDPDTGAPVVRLVEKGHGLRNLPIWVGPFEAEAIALQLHGGAPPRPLTHDLMKQLIESLGGRLDRVVIEDLRDDTYFARLHLATRDGRDLAVDARPSDAIALALRLHGPILVAEEVFAKASASLPGPAAAHVWGLTLQDLTPELAGFFSGAGVRGVLVSDVAPATPTRDVRRGDVITALDGDPVASATDVVRRSEGRPGDHPVRLSLWRGGHEIIVDFAAR
jgi:uncharacterized protein